MSNKHWYRLAASLRFVSYLLVFYAGLKIGADAANAGLWPILALVGAVITGCVSGLLTSVLDQGGSIQ